MHSVFFASGCFSCLRLLVVVDFTRRGGTYKAGYTTTRDCLYTTLTTMKRGLEATLVVTMLARLTIGLMTQLSVDGLGPLWV
jgi:hypothetical protein